MKFDFGHWNILPDTEALYPLAITNAYEDAESLTIQGYSKPVQGRWSFLDGAMVSVRFSSPNRALS